MCSVRHGGNGGKACSRHGERLGQVTVCSKGSMVTDGPPSMLVVQMAGWELLRHCSGGERQWRE